ncbi:peroxiredoxin-6 isoform X1 [Cephus cinctus]|uniref:1-Cys peroxiredoxin n=1 Tax=Cephus cinctus TaxID=211228 RepID=A0AAJ7BLL2_CEPCN|nr:peroxiredoxin-6 isoform X1 [Cephus cinctus]
MRLGTKIPNFEAYTTKGKIHFHNWSGNSWVLMFSHPADFTPVCTTELGRLAERAEEFKRRGVKLLGHSCDSLESHLVWIKDIQAKYRRIPKVFPYPIIGDETREIAEMLDMVDEREPSSRGVRAVLVIDPQKILRLFLLYPDTTGRNIDEIFRVIQALQLSSRAPVATPVDWQPGDEVLVCPNVPESEEARLFPHGVQHVAMPSGLAYIRYTSDYLAPHECWE